jgi:hypothetical protein
VSNADGARLFTVADASALLPKLRAKLEMLQRGKRELREIHETLRSISPVMRSNGSGSQAHALEEAAAGLVARMGVALAEIEETGVIIKDLDMGLVDFPALREGRVVFLCWMASEQAITHWHETDEGYTGRRPL